MSTESTTRADYRELRDAIVSFAHDLVDFSASMRDEESQRRLREMLESRMRELEHHEFVVVVIGEMKHGKSTFLNAMLRKPAFPRDVREATAAVTFLKHNDEIRESHPDWVDKAVVRYTDGRPDDVVGHLELEKYTTCLHNEELNVAENVKEVVIYSDSEFVRDGVTVVDTPGTNTTNRQHEEITYRQIDRSHAAIFLFKAGEAGKSSDFQFLEDTAETIKRFFFVVNRVDEIGGIHSEVTERVIEDIKRKVSDNVRLNALVNQARFFPTSGLKALQARWPDYVCDYSGMLSREQWERDYRGQPDKLRQLDEESGMPAFEEELLKFLFKGDKMRIMFETELEVLKKELGVLRRQLDERGEVLSQDMTMQKLQERRELLTGQKAERERQLATMGEKLIDALNEAMTDFQQQTETEAAQRLSEFRQELMAYQSFERLLGDSEQLKGKVRRGVDSFMRRTTMELRDQIQRVFRKADATLRGQLKQGLEADAVLQLPEMPEFKVNLQFEKIEELDENPEYRRLSEQVARLEEEETRSADAELELKLAQQRMQQMESEKQETLSLYQTKVTAQGARPAVEMRMVDPGGTREVSRGIIMDFFFGKKTVTEPPVMEPDDSAQREYDETMRRLNAELDQKQAELNRRIQEQCQKVEARQRDAMKAAAIAKLRQENERKREACEHRLKEEQQRQKADALERGKSTLSGAMQQQLDAYVETLRGMTANCRDWAETHISGIQGSLDEQVRQRTEELNQLERQMEANDQDRQRMQAELETANARYGELDAALGRLSGEVMAYTISDSQEVK